MTYPALIVQSSSGPPALPLSSEVASLASIWQKHYRFARRSDGPLDAAIQATLSTAQTWRWLHGPG